jgi:hypothetical protein
MSETLTFTLCPVCGIAIGDDDHNFLRDTFDHNFCVDSGVVTRDADGEPVWFVNVYEVSRVYGGPQEGGWYYDAGQLLATYVAPGGYESALSLRDKLRNDEWANTGTASSVVYSGGEYEFEFTLGAPAPAFFPEGIPQYE